MNNFEWDDHKIFIAAPREISINRLTQLIKHYLPKGNIVLGISAEDYVVGFENQPQFKMLQQATVQPIIDKVTTSSSPFKIHIFVYSQNDLTTIVKNLNHTQRILLVNGSWKYAFHNSDAYKVLVRNNVSIKFISPFTDEIEARAYEISHTPLVTLPSQGTLLSETEMFAVADKASVQSFDYSFQTGTVIGQKQESGYRLLMTAFNRVIPYQSYALHFGNSRERNLSRPHDTNHYDTIHAEMEAIVMAGRQAIDLQGTTLFVNLLPCPNCARTLSQTGISEFIYRHNHSDGYAVKLLEACGKKVKQVS